MLLFSYLLKMSDNKVDQLNALLRNKPPKDATIYDDTQNKPPWYRDGLLDYLKTRKVRGLESCIEWIKGH